MDNHFHKWMDYETGPSLESAGGHTHAVKTPQSSGKTSASANTNGHLHEYRARKTGPAIFPKSVESDGKETRIEGVTEGGQSVSFLSKDKNAAMKVMGLSDACRDVLLQFTDFTYSNQ